MTTLKKPDARKFNSVTDYLAADNAYNTQRAEMGQSGGRAGHEAIDFLADILRQSHRGRLTREQMEKLSGAKYQSIAKSDGKNQASVFTRSGQERRFGNWGTARKFALEALDLGIIDKKGTVSTRAIAKDIRRVAQANNINVLELKRADYLKMGRFTKSNIEKRFGGWTNAREQAFDMFVNHDWVDIR